MTTPGDLPFLPPVMLIAGLLVVIAGSLLMLRIHVQRRVQAERERDRLYRLSLDMLCVFGFDGAFRRCNPAFEHTLGYGPEQMVGRTLVDIVHSDDVTATMEHLRRLASGEATQFENRCRCSDGTYKWLTWSVNPEIEDKLVYAVAHDITGRKATEDALRAESAFRKTMEDSVITGLR
ncbi:MAG: PAS domain S-box protein, partial [Proteobacteria bacterium]|nr:PAS domain S-box protein [Pseudomonadota bacterium]